MATAMDPKGNITEIPHRMTRRFSVDEYHRMIDAGVFASDNRFELLEGWIVAKMTKNPPHVVAVLNGQQRLARHLLEGWHVRVEAPLTTTESEPEPDLAIVRANIRDYIDHHPGRDEIALVIEVSESTLSEDRHWKARVYAHAGIRVYWIINLVDEQVEVYTEPSGPGESPAYANCEDFTAGEMLPLILDGIAVAQLPVADLLP